MSLEKKFALASGATVVIVYVVFQTVFADALAVLFTDKMVRTIMLILLTIVFVQSVALYFVAAQRVRVPVSSTPSDDTKRGKGRPANPCELAMTGFIHCPLKPDLKVSPEFINRLAVEIEKYRLRVLSEATAKSAEPVSEVEVLEEKKIEEPKEKKVDTGSQENPELPKNTDKGVGEVLVALQKQGFGDKKEKKK